MTFPTARLCGLSLLIGHKLLLAARRQEWMFYLLGKRDVAELQSWHTKALKTSLNSTQVEGLLWPGRIW